MRIFKIKLFALLYIFCFLRIGLTASSLNDVKEGECHYLAPTQLILNEAFFNDLIIRSYNKNETFEKIASFLEQSASSCHRFQFKYPLKDSNHAQIFAKVLQIKAQEAHRFVPAISHSHFISSCHLGFIRKISIQGNGPTIQEHVLVDLDSNKVIFIEEFLVNFAGEIELGSFAAINQVVEENGSWYFAGTYLYNWEPESDKKINETTKMFRDTYENMISFIEKEDVEVIYQQLSDY